jgi:hypothetical protein
MSFFGLNEFKSYRMAATQGTGVIVGAGPG